MTKKELIEHLLSERAIQAGAAAYRDYRDAIYRPRKPCPRKDGDHTAALAQTIIEQALATAQAEP